MAKKDPRRQSQWNLVTEDKVGSQRRQSHIPYSQRVTVADLKNIADQF